MRIGLDFDNTLAGYDHLFRQAAASAGLTDAAGGATKKAVRDLARASAEGDIAWQRLQALVYGRLMPEAALIDGVAPFLAECRRRGWRVVIVSHKTATAPYDPDCVDLRAAARGWMAGQGFFDGDRFAIDPADVHFCATRSEKIDRIASIECAAFVDDLEEVLTEPAFPAGPERYLYHPALPLPDGPFRAFADWTSLGRDLFDRLG